MHVITLRIASLGPVIEAVEEELLKARNKFPANKHMVHAFTEEHGEVVKAMLDQYHSKMSHQAYAPEEYDRDNQEIKKELIQTICMAIRVLQEGDADFPYNPN